MGYLEYFRLFLLILSLVGIFIFVRHRFKIPVELIPVTVFSSIGLLVFFSGILNIMKLICLLIVLFGLYGYRYIRIVLSDRRFVTSNIIFFLVCTCFFIFLKDSIFILYDNFSHWGLVAREILETNSFPNFKTPLISFQSYITGSTSFIYYICKVVGTKQEGIMMFAQSLINISAVYSISVFINRKNITLVFPITCFGIYLAVSNILPYDLPVDTLLSSLSIVLIVILLKYKDNFNEGVWLFSIVASYLVTIKSSGIFFVISGFILMYLIVKNTSILRIVRYQLLILTGILLINYIWKAHVSYVYVSGNNSKHSVNLNSYKENLLDKGKSKILEILKDYVNKFLTLYNLLWYILLFSTIIIVISKYLSMNKVKISNYLRFTVGLFFSYFLYHVLLFSMYVFSMPYNEAKNLDSFERYDLTVVVYLLGSIISYIASENLFETSFYKVISICVLILLPSFQGYKYVKDTLPSYSNSIRQRVHKSVVNSNVDTTKEVSIFIDKDTKVSKGYLWYVLRYELRSENIRIVTFENEDEINYENSIRI